MSEENMVYGLEGKGVKFQRRGACRAGQVQDNLAGIERSGDVTHAETSPIVSAKSGSEATAAQLHVSVMSV